MSGSGTSHGASPAAKRACRVSVACFVLAAPYSAQAAMPSAISTSATSTGAMLRRKRWFMAAWPRPAQAPPARSSMACSSTLAPAAQCPEVASSISAWLMPSLQGTKIMAVGARRDTYTASWPAPLVIGIAS